MSGFALMLARNAVETAAIMIEPASAVPSEAPRFVIVFWTPPTSGLSSSGTADTVTAPSCEASAPMPSPISSIGTNTISAPAVGVEPAEQDDGAGEQREEPAADDQPRRDVREQPRDRRSPPRAA